MICRLKCVFRAGSKKILTSNHILEDRGKEERGESITVTQKVGFTQELTVEERSRLKMMKRKEQWQKPILSQSMRRRRRR